LSLSPEMMPVNKNFSSIDSLNRYILYQNSTNCEDIKKSGIF
jgi:hypothetical protein